MFVTVHLEGVWAALFLSSGSVCRAEFIPSRWSESRSTKMSKRFRAAPSNLPRLPVACSQMGERRGVTLVRTCLVVLVGFVATACFAAHLQAATALSVVTPSSVVNVANGTAAVDVPVSFSLSGVAVRSLTLQVLYDSTKLSLANSDVSLGSLISGWTLTPNATAGKLIVSLRTSSPLDSTTSPLSGDILELNFHVDQGVSGFAPITYLTPTVSQQAVFSSSGQNLASTTTFNNGGINASWGGSTWVSATSGSWSTTANWNGSPPQNPGDKATFDGAPSSTLSISLDTSRVAGELAFSNSGSSLTGYSLTSGVSGTGKLTLNNSGSDAKIQVLNGSHSIAAPITLASNLDFSVLSNAYFTVSGNISQSTTAGLNLSGAGELILSGSDSYTGGTTVAGGTLLLESAAALPTGSGLTIGAGAGVLFTASGNSSPADLVVTGSEPPSAGLLAEPVPEPGMLALAVVALASAAIYRCFFRQLRTHRSDG